YSRVFQRKDLVGGSRQPHHSFAMQRSLLIDKPKRQYEFILSLKHRSSPHPLTLVAQDDPARRYSGSCGAARRRQLTSTRAITAVYARSSRSQLTVRESRATSLPFALRSTGSNLLGHALKKFHLTTS